MDYDDTTDSTRGLYTDSVQWQGSQTACAALDSLLSEAAFKSHPEVFRTSKDPTSKRSNAKGASHSLRPSFALASTSLSSRSFENIPGSSTSSGMLSSRQSTPNSSSSTPGSLNLLNDCRSRQSRSSTPIVVNTPPLGDPNQFLSMLKGISERIDGNIRSDASTSTDMPRRRPPSKRISNNSNVSAKRVKHNNPLASRTSGPEGSVKGKTPDVGEWSCGPTDMPLAPKRTNGSHKNCSAQMSTDILSEMDVDQPRMSPEIMPPPPVPLPRTEGPISDSTTRSNQLHSPASSSTPVPQTMGQNAAGVSWHLPTQSYPQTKSLLPAQILPPTPAPTPKLHPLLDPERKQRRLRLERTISASMSLSPAEIPSTSKPKRQRQHQTRVQPSPPYPGTLPHSQGSVAGSVSRQPTLGMRRTHTFPTTSQKLSTSSVEPTTSFSQKQKTFKPPLLSSSQPLSMTSTNSCSRGSVLSDESPSSKTSPPTSSEVPASKSADETMDDLLPPSSDGDISFGDAVPLDMDMDALEETMRKYD